MIPSVRLSLTALATAALLTTAVSCDSADGPTTSCNYSYDATITAKDFGQACTEDSECAQGVCMMPPNL